MSSHINLNSSSQLQSSAGTVEHSNDQPISEAEDHSTNSDHSSLEHSSDQSINQSNDSSTIQPQPSRPPVTNITQPTYEQWVQLFEDIKIYPKSKVQRNNPGLSYTTLFRRAQFYLDGDVKRATKKLSLYRLSGIRKKRKAVDQKSSDDDDDSDDSDFDDSTPIKFGTVNRKYEIGSKRESLQSEEATTIKHSGAQVPMESNNSGEVIPKRSRGHPRKNPIPVTQSQSMQPTIDQSGEMHQNESHQLQSVNQTYNSEVEIIIKWEHDQIAIVREQAQRALKALRDVEYHVRR